MRTIVSPTVLALASFGAISSAKAQEVSGEVLHGGLAVVEPNVVPYAPPRVPPCAPIVDRADVGREDEIHSPSMVITGSIATAIGIAASIVGAYFIVGDQQSHSDLLDGRMTAVGAVPLAIGIAHLAVGVPLIVVGVQREQPEAVADARSIDTVQVDMGPMSIGVRMTF